MFKLAQSDDDCVRKPHNNDPNSEYTTMVDKRFEVTGLYLVMDLW